MPLTLSFQGMCLFVQRDKQSDYDAYLPPSAKRRAILMAATDFIASVDPDDAANWAPDVIVGSSDDPADPVQTAIWYLAGHDIVITSNGGKVEEWKNRSADCVDFARFHPRLRARSTAEIKQDLPDTCTIKLTHGTPSHRRMELETVRNDEWDETKQYAHQVVWSGLEMTLECTDLRKSIRFKPGAGVQPYATISNLAVRTLPDFGLYYDKLVDLNGHQPLTMTHLGGEVYDCVPPVPTS